MVKGVSSQRPIPGTEPSGGVENGAVTPKLARASIEPRPYREAPWPQPFGQPEIPAFSSAGSPGTVHQE